MSTTPESTTPSVPQKTPMWRTITLSTVLTALIAVVLLAFSWPALTAEPKGVALALTGPEAAVSAVQPLLEEQAGDTFDITTVDDRDAAVEGIEQRDYAGAIILGTEPELLTASANGTINQVIAGLADPLQEALDAQATAQAAAMADAQGLDASAIAAPEITLAVTDVVPLSEDDPNGSLLTSAFFPILFGGMIGGIVISTAIVGSLRRIVGVTVYSAVGGLVLTSILQNWFGAIQGDFLTNWGAFALAIGAIAAPIIGFVGLLGRAGIAVGPVVMMLFANPISGAALPAQFLPGIWGTVGQWFPPGAAATLVRELSYFPDANMLFSWLVLGAWFVGGLLLAFVGHLREQRRAATALVMSTTAATTDAAPAEQLVRA
ncbi:hypothetical protein GCM10017608_10520 [Agromyces luteolus]|uniref:ABC transporter permease n=1 Tax=Agromyces luteolus TaxID=88373 RepID=A0A7C9HNI1_9MICO|nr:hypothetical protein [Agromyces luteolus]MUN08582.1 hypothetical protein [Agromyces luteolus]GLK27119.1 hypothetical protein GCM10017608_10520 [Agromyces luteolus]